MANGNFGEGIPSGETEETRAQTWLYQVRGALQQQVDYEAFRAANRIKPGPGGPTPDDYRGELDEADERFLAALESKVETGDTYVQAGLARLQDRNTQGYVAPEQFETLRLYLDTPDFYES